VSADKMSDAMALPIVEEYHRIDIREWHRQKLLRPGRFEWVCSEQLSVTVEVNLDRVLLKYGLQKPNRKPEKVEQQVYLDYSPCHYGGERPWFRCPGCERRVAILCFAGRFRCPRCLGLVYQTQQMSESDRRLHRIRKTRLRLGGSRSLLDSFPPKPSGMRWSTYRRLEQADRLAVLQELDRHQRRSP
jgi:hypothetical protein